MARFASAIVSLLILAGCNTGGEGNSSTLAKKPAVTLAADSVGVIDAARNLLVARIAVGHDPLDVVIAGGSVWVTNVTDESVTQIDAATRKVVRTIKLPATPTGLSAGEGSLWVTAGREGTVERIDVDTGKVEDVVRLRPALRTQFFSNVTTRLRGAAWMPVLATAGSVWVGDAFSSRIFRLDPRHGRVIGTIDGYEPYAFAAAPSEIWIIDYPTRKLVAIASESGRVLREIQINRNTAPKALAVAGGSLWIANSGPSAGLPPNFVWRVSATGGAMSEQVAVGYLPDAIAADASAVWVGSWGDQSVTKIDTRTNSAVRTIRLGHPIGGLAAGDGVVWVTAQ
jgi:YVTN family beta-propeller protein